MKKKFFLYDLRWSTYKIGQVSHSNVLKTGTFNILINNLHMTLAMNMKKRRLWKNLCLFILSYPYILCELYSVPFKNNED